jgi:hypothetical protein
MLLRSGCRQMRRTQVPLQRHMVDLHSLQAALSKAPLIPRVSGNGVIGAIETGEEENTITVRKAEYPEPPPCAGLVDEVTICLLLEWLAGPQQPVHCSGDRILRSRSIPSFPRSKLPVISMVCSSRFMPGQRLTPRPPFYRAALGRSRNPFSPRNSASATAIGEMDERSLLRDLEPFFVLFVIKTPFRESGFKSKPDDDHERQDQGLSRRDDGASPLSLVGASPLSLVGALLRIFSPRDRPRRSSSSPPTPITPRFSWAFIWQAGACTGDRAFFFSMTTRYIWA